jgi:hypothetical protein
MATPNIAVSTATPPSAYIPMTNSHSSDRPRPIPDMPRLPQYRLLSGRENAFSTPENRAVDPLSTPTTWSSDGHDQARGIYNST